MDLLLAPLTHRLKVSFGDHRTPVICLSICQRGAPVVQWYRLLNLGLRECSGSVEGCMTLDRGVMGSSLICVSVLCS